MPEITEGGSKVPMRITIEAARNGVIVCGTREDSEDKLEYVYDSLKKAIKELPSLWSVLEQDQKKVTKDELDEEEEMINKKGGDY